MLEDDQDFWDEFVPLIESGRVIPVVGPELLRVEIDGQKRSIDSVIATRLAQRLKISCESNPAPKLEEVASRFLSGGGRRSDLFPKLHAVLSDVKVGLPRPIRQLARISDFSLLISLTCDSLLKQAVDEERFAGREMTQHLAYAPNQVTDLPCERARLSHPVVYSLFGKHSVSPNYVVTEEDTLEFLCSLQSESRRPPILFDELAASHLLILGCSFPDWLARFFIRTTKKKALSRDRDEREYWVDAHVEADHSLVLFLTRFSRETRIISRDPEQFIDRMEQEWQRRRSRIQNGARHPKELDGPDDFDADFGNSPPAVFVSYAKEDQKTAELLCEALRNAEIEVWFDQERLEGGDLYDQKIRKYIQTCTLFIPLISVNTERRKEGYFRREWRLADNRRQGIADSIQFIVPVSLGEIDPNLSETPDSFKLAHWITFRDASPRLEDVAHLRKLLREHVKRRVPS